MATRLSSALQHKVTFTVITSILLAMRAQAGFVELFQEMKFQGKTTRLSNVQTDVCYDFVCSDSDFAAISAKWGGLPETGITFEGGSAMIAFYTDRNCTSDYKWWPVDSQSDGDLGFPDNLPFNVYSFLVINTWSITRLESTCPELATIDTRIATIE
ncbi:hypothetical protein ON010_g2322 [Phytophthora cinnamomi]|nr:hypothetical protein ON010_g2322 [Phytophthora cinnamomi]